MHGPSTSGDERPVTLRSLAAFTVLSLAAAFSAAAQEDGAPVSIGSYRVIESQALGETRRLLIHLPRGYDGAAISYPVVYHTYGDYLSEYYAEAFAVLEELGNSARIPQVILVGIDNIDRYRDLRPLSNDGAPSGVDDYVKFLVDEVFPFVEGHYRANGYRILAGPQAGAIFGLYALQQHPDLFDAFILNNPLVSPPNTELLLARAESFYASQPSLRKFVYITFGGSGDSPGEIANVYRLAEIAAPAADKGLELHLNNLLDNDDFIPPLELGKALRTLFRDYHVGDRRFTDLAEITAFYEGLSHRYGFDVPAAELMMTLSADALRQRGEIDKAIEILEYDTTLYPNMVNPWWQLAGIAAEQGHIDRAISFYEKCLAIDPSMANFVRRRIEALR
jgi:predicted alpha/beta superfamily hydrolase